jgi:hypothetical protein
MSSTLMYSYIFFTRKFLLVNNSDYGKKRARDNDEGDLNVAILYNATETAAFFLNKKNELNEAVHRFLLSTLFLNNFKYRL